MSTFTADATKLCTSCGLCCTGAIHDAALLDADEVAHAEQIGLLLTDDTRPKFALPCRKLDGTCCTIFDQRPRVCGRYECRLLMSLKAGDVALGPALEVVETARRLSEEAIMANSPGTDLPSARDKVLEHAMNGGGALPGPQESDAMLKTMALIVYLQKHFRKADEPPFLRF